MNLQLPSLQERNPTRVAVIGSGVSGLAVAKYLLAERVKQATDTKYFQVTVFERCSEVAGIWNFDSKDDEFQTPMYEDLYTNVPRTMMEYKNFPYPKDTSMFPTRDKIKHYLETYSREIRYCIKLNSEVTCVTRLIRNYEKKWKVEVRNTVLGNSEEIYFDAVVVATGTFNQIYVPPYGELDEWTQAYPGSIIHSRDYRSPEKFANKKVLIIGGGPSYFDIARRIFEVTGGQVLVSTRTPVPLISSPNQRQVPAPKQLLTQQKAVQFIDDSIEEDIDIILLCTGYKYEFRFIPMMEVSNDGSHVLGLWKQIFCISEPTLVFVGLLKMSAIFTLVEAQSAYIARVFSQRLDLPSRPTMREEATEEIRKFEADVAAGLVNPNAFHNMRYPLDKEYINQLSAASYKAKPLPGKNNGKQPPLYGAYMDWTRANTGRMREAFEEKGAGKHTFTSPESLGFWYR